MSGLVSGLQNRVRRFESARNLKMPAHAGFFISSSQDVLLSSFPFVAFYSLPVVISSVGYCVFYFLSKPIKIVGLEIFLCKFA